MYRTRSKSNSVTSSEMFLFSFKRVVDCMLDNPGAFYFYPGELKGFIESCVLACQRENNSSYRKALMYEDIMSARKLWDGKLEIQLGQSVTFSNSKNDYRMSVEDYECQMAYDQGLWIEEEVLAQIASLRNVVGNFSIDNESFQWTGASALAVRVNY